MVWRGQLTQTTCPTHSSISLSVWQQMTLPLCSFVPSITNWPQFTATNCCADFINYLLMVRRQIRFIYININSRCTNSVSGYSFVFNRGQNTFLQQPRTTKPANAQKNNNNNNNNDILAMGGEPNLVRLRHREKYRTVKWVQMKANYNINKNKLGLLVRDHPFGSCFYRFEIGTRPNETVSYDENLWKMVYPKKPSKLLKPLCGSSDRPRNFT